MISIFLAHLFRSCLFNAALEESCVALTSKREIIMRDIAIMYFSISLFVVIIVFTGKMTTILTYPQKFPNHFNKV